MAREPRLRRSSSMCICVSRSFAGHGVVPRKTCQTTTQCKGLLSQQMASRSAIATTNLRVGKSSQRYSCHHRHTESCKENKTKQNKTCHRASRSLSFQRCPSSRHPGACSKNLDISVSVLTNWAIALVLYSGTVFQFSGARWAVLRSTNWLSVYVVGQPITGFAVLRSCETSDVTPALPLSAK